MTAKAKKPDAPARSFRLRDKATIVVDGDEQPVNHVSFGDRPPVSIATGHTFTTTDAKTAARCASHQLLEEVTGT